MSGGLELYVEGIGLWTPRLAGWEFARPVLRGGAAAPEVTAKRPDPVVLPPAERRRCPDSVALALAVAAAACAQAQREPASLPAVFASAYGDPGITDYLCATLAQDPTLLSPTRFHNSVHNAAAGYWTIATGCMEPCTALAAGDETFATALLSAAAQVHAQRTPLLLVAYDTGAVGPLATVVPSRGLFGAALVLAPARTERTLARVVLGVQAEEQITVARAANAALVERNAMAPCLPLFEALADAMPRTVHLGLGAGGVLAVNCQPTNPGT